jgi:hypothetical protein
MVVFLVGVLGSVARHPFQRYPTNPNRLFRMFFARLLLSLWTKAASAAAIDSTVLIARGGAWHKKDREKGEVAIYFH